MSSRKKIFAFAIFIFVVLVGSLHLFVLHLERIDNRLANKLRQVELGMTREQVMAIVGEPLNASTSDLLGVCIELWTYPNQASTSGDYSCRFDCENGRVIAITINEDYIRDEVWYSTHTN